MSFYQYCTHLNVYVRLGCALKVPKNTIFSKYNTTTLATTCTTASPSLFRSLSYCAVQRTKFSPKINDATLRSPSSEDHLQEIKQKLLFNSVLETRHMKFGRVRTTIETDKRERRPLKRSDTSRSDSNDLPISLRYMPDYNETVQSQATSGVDSPDEGDGDKHVVQLPFKIAVDTNRSQELTRENMEISRFSNATVGRKPSNWMTDYEVYDEANEVDENTDDEEDVRPWQMDYGTSNPSVPVTKVPCGGCGALLHCQNTAIPGYLPSEILQHRSKSELRSIVCQRCHFLRHYDTALAVSVPADEYPRILSQIREKRALVLLMVDLMDVPCSIWPNILDIIGTKRPVVVVGNKVDLLPRDCPGFLGNVERVLRDCLARSGVTAANIKHVALVSAKTGYGVDQLITKMHNEWEYKGDVYLIGCTNTGKSTLFNALLQSDYCKVQAVDLIQRATTSPWPGTTLNLLKFPILRPSAWRLHVRTQRLISQRGSEARRLRGGREGATLMGHIGRTFLPEQPVRPGADVFSVGGGGRAAVKVGIDERDEDYRDSRWCYDTPGTVHRDQLINLLTTEELMLTLPSRLLHPRTFSLSPGSSLLVAGLARLDLLQAAKAVRLTVFASDKLPLTVCRTSDADQVYSRLIGSELMAVPVGVVERMNQWPGLAPSREGNVQLVGEDWRRSCADIVLSSAGWVSVTPGPDMGVELRAWTPEGRGVRVRSALLPFSVNHRGARIRRSPAYGRGAGLDRILPS